MADKPAPRRSWRRRAIIAVAVLVLLVVGAVAALPLLVDSDAARRAIQRRISAVAGGEVSYDSLAIRLFPQPRADLRGASLRVADAVDGRVDEIRIGIALLPLLAGNVRPTSIRLAQPAEPAANDPTSAPVMRIRSSFMVRCSVQGRVVCPGTSDAPEAREEIG